MDTAQLEVLSIDELWRLHEELNRLLSSKLVTEKRALERRLEQLRRENEIVKNGDHVPFVKQRRAYPKVQPKYRSPDDPKKTWSGRGKRPKWLAAAMQTGRTLEDFLIGDRVHEAIER